LATNKLPYALQGKNLVPRYLGAEDHNWIFLLQQEFSRFVGKSKRQLQTRLREPLPFIAPRAKRYVVEKILWHMYRTHNVADIKPCQLRETLFLKAAQERTLKNRIVIIKQVADKLQISTDKLEAWLFSDLALEQNLLAPEQAHEPHDIALRANLALLQNLLKHCMSLELTLYGQTRPVIRHAKFRGLICTIKQTRTPQDATRLAISGPLSVCKHTTVYGHAMGELLPMLHNCNQFQAHAQLLLRGDPCQLTLNTGDPFMAKTQNKRYDSNLEKWFIEDFSRATTDWDIIREPTPIQVGEACIFPDFILKNRKDSTKLFWLEIIGFWTTDYIRNKTQKLIKANLNNLILCVNESLRCDTGQLPQHATVLFFKKRVSIPEVLRIIIP